MTDKKKNDWIKFVPSLDLPKERVSIAYDTHDERGYRFAYGYFQFYNGTCSCFWKDGNEQPKVVKVEDIKYWMPVPPLDVQEEPVSEEWIEELRTRLDSMSKEDFKKVFDKYAVDFNEEPVSVWHDAKDTPVASKTKIVLYTNGKWDMFKAYETKDDYDNYWAGVNQVLEEKGVLVKRWAYVEDLLKL